MNYRTARLFVFLCIASLISSAAYAQGASSTTSLAGIVVDKDGGVIPGASVVVKNTATGESTQAVTNSVGGYSFPSLSAGTYTVTISLSGFKTWMANDVRLLAATPGSIKTTLEIGSISQTVEVRGGTDLVRTQSPTVSSTVSAEFIKSVPRADRNALNFLIFLPGVETAGGARASTISGLPQNTISITIDGVSTGNNLQSDDGFFSLVVPRLDAIEEVSLTSAAAGADSSGQGATSVRFVTRSGTNQFKETLYNYLRHASLNTNTYFNRLSGLPRPRATQNQYGGSAGGPILIPGLIDGRGKAFFFYNQELSYQPNEVSRTRTVLRESALNGDFTYNLTSPTTVNVLALAAANGQLASKDPVILALLNQINAATKTTGTITATSTNLTTNAFAFLVPVASLRNSPTGRVDLNLTPKHRLSGSYYWQGFQDDPDTLNNADPTFPGFPAHARQNSFRTTGSSTLRSTFSANLVNSVVAGWQWSPIDFFGDATPSMFDNQGGYALTLGTVGSQLTNAAPGNASAPQPRNTINWNVDDTLNWLKGNHNFQFGSSFTRLTNWGENWNVVPTVNLGFNTTLDPAIGLFNTTNFPGASAGNLTDARQLYSLLTGRVSSIAGTGRLNTSGTEYIYNGHLYRAQRMDEWGFFAQDSWRWKPNVTLNLGLRYELQGPMVPTTSNITMSTLTDLCGVSGPGNGPQGRMCNIANPGVLNNAGQIPTYVKYDAGNPGYNIDYNNIAPNVGIAWRPNVQTGFFRKLLGDPEQGTVTGGFTRSFNRERIDRFTAVFNGNPGPTTPATRGTAAGNFPLVLANEAWPLLLRESSRMGAPAFNATPVFPITAQLSAGNDIRIFDPEIETPYTDSWTMGVQRSLGKDMAVEVRYVGNENKKPWSTVLGTIGAGENWNVANFRTNGLLEEFKLAQANLKANVLAGRTGFGYFGPGTGTSPLPIFLAHFTGLPAAQAGVASNYTTGAFANAAQFTNTTWVNRLDYSNPDPQGIATNLWTGNSGVWRTNMLAAGLPLNFWVLNPLVDEASVMRNQGGSKYNSMQVDLRRRFSKGLQVQGSYTYARGSGLSVLDMQTPLLERRSTTIPHAVKMLWVWDLPVGRGRRFGTNMNPWVDGLLGGWQFSGSGRVQVPLFRLTNTKLVGMSRKEAQDAFKKIRFTIDAVTGATTIWDMPLDITDNTRKAYNTDPTQVTGYAANDVPTGRYFAPASSESCMALYAQDCAPDMFFYGKWFGEFDFKLVKRFRLPGKATFEFSAEIFNALYAKNFSQNFNPGNGANIFRITATNSAARTGQLVWRVNW